MVLPSWWQVVTPHKDVQENRLSEAVFAADLGDVLSGYAPQEYKDARLFFIKTYLTIGLKNLVENVFNRLSGDSVGDPVIQIQTPFGGGKTHSLLTLYHLAKSFDDVKHLEQIKEVTDTLPSLPKVNVAAFVGTSPDVIKGKTPWGEIAYQVGCYDIVEEHDKKRVAPGKDLIRAILDKSGPTLILVDELLEYIVRASRFEEIEKIMHGQTLAFLQELSEAVSVSKNAVLVLSLPSSVLEKFDEKAEMAERSLSQLQKVSGRVETIYIPVEGMEIYEIIRKRLLENYGDITIHRQVAEAYFNLYYKLGNDVPPEVKRVDYREKIENAYPFHPELIDVLYERWGSFPTFQRTRGVLRLLAMVISDLYYRKVTSPLIHSSLVNLDNTSLRREFIKHIGNEYEAVIEADISRKAKSIDKEMGSEYQKYDIAKGLSTGVFIYSFSGGDRKGMSLPWLRTSFLREGISSTIVGDAVNKLERALWYFHTERGFYRFKNVPTLNRIVLDREETIGDLEVEEEFKDQIEKILGKSPVRIYLWPENPTDIPDNKQLKLLILSSDYLFNENETNLKTDEIATTSGISPRVYKNAVFFLTLDIGLLIGLEKRIRSYLALLNIKEDKDLSLTPNTIEELKSKIKVAKDDLPHFIIHAYRHIGWCHQGGVVWRDMGIPSTEKGQTISGRTYQYLKDEERILSSVSPRLILSKTVGLEEKEKPLMSMYDCFFKIPGLPCIENVAIFIEALKRGVVDGLMGVRLGDKIYYKDQLYIGEDLEGFYVHKEMAEEEVGNGGKDNGDNGNGGPVPPNKKVKELSIIVNVRWDKLSDVISGVIRPLKDAGSELEIVLDVKAVSNQGLDRMTLDSKVKETLQQLGSKIEKWDEIEK